MKPTVRSRWNALFGLSLLLAFSIAATSCSPTVTVGHGPVDVAIHSGRNIAVVACSEGRNLSIVSLATSDLMHVVRFSTGKPMSVAVDEALDLAVVTLFRDQCLEPAIALVDLETWAVSHVCGLTFCKCQSDVAINPDTHEAFVVAQFEGRYQLLVVDLAAPALIRTIRLASEPTRLAYDPGTNVAVILNKGIPTINTVDLDALVPGPEPLDLPGVPLDAAILPGMGKAVITLPDGTMGSNLAFVNLDTCGITYMTLPQEPRYVTARVPLNQIALSYNDPVTSMVGLFNLTSQSFDASLRLPLFAGPMAWSDLTDTLVVTHPSEDAVSVF